MRIPRERDTKNRERLKEESVSIEESQRIVKTPEKIRPRKLHGVSKIQKSKIFLFAIA
jgi:hypothetical protein